MNSENPYHAPKDTTVEHSASPALLLWSVAVVFGSALFCGLIGLAIGSAIGSLAPGYYRSIFSNGSDPSFDPVAVGVGQGLTQGLAFGAVIGLILVGMFYWYRLQSQRRISR